MNSTIQTLINALKALPGFPFYLMGIAVAYIGYIIQSITGGFISDEVISGAAAIFTYIGSLFIIK